MPREQIGVDVDHIMIISFANYMEDVVELKNKLNCISRKLNKLLKSDDINDNTKQQIKPQIKRIKKYTQLLEQIEDDIFDFVFEKRRNENPS